VVGLSENGSVDPLASGFPTLRAVLWKEGAINDLGAFAGGNTSLAYAVNSRGQVVGFAQNGISDVVSLGAFFVGLPTTTQTRAFLWHNGAMQEAVLQLPME
jgi:uncharacterized membrane protein